MIDVSVIVPCWGERVREVGDCVFRNWQEFGNLVKEFIIVTELGSHLQLRAELQRAFSGIPPMKVVSIEINDKVTKGRLLNAAAANSKANLLLFLDCDILLTTKCVEQMVEVTAYGNMAYLSKLTSNLTETLSSEGYVDIIRHVVEIRLVDGRAASVERSALYLHTGCRSGPGIVCLARTQFLEVEGYNGSLVGYGWEDIDLLLRIGLVTGGVAIGVGSGVHKSLRLSRTQLNNRLAQESENYQNCLADYCLGILSGTLKDDSLISFCSIEL